jgi:AhpC/TSA antioxidant enzyme
VSQLRQREGEFDDLGLRIVVVTFEARERAEDYVREAGLAWPLLIDRQRVLYRAYGMAGGRRSAIWGPATWWAYARLIARGHRLRRPTGDVNQLGGDVLVDPTGRVGLHHVGRGPADRPAVGALLERVRQGQAT